MLDQNVLHVCRQKLLEAKADLLNRFHSHYNDFRERESGGDEADQSVSIMNETQLLATQRRLREQLMEIEAALARIEKGTYGVCEETEEPIECERLLAIPWTRLSLEGAEIRESNPPKRRA
jgi:DnaK suppressor protein